MPRCPNDGLTFGRLLAKLVTHSSSNRLLHRISPFLTWCNYRYNREFLTSPSVFNNVGGSLGLLPNVVDRSNGGIAWLPLEKSIHSVHKYMIKSSALGGETR